MCGFCHAPEHAYEALLEQPELDPSGLCIDAQERLRMAATPEPLELPGIEHAWDENSHEWIAWRAWGDCATCGAHTWRYAAESCAHECKRCQTDHIERSLQMFYHHHGFVPQDWEIERCWLERHPRQVTSPVRWDWLKFSDYPVTDTTLFENIPGPRFGRPRPRIMFGQAARSARYSTEKKARAAIVNGIRSL